MIVHFTAAKSNLEENIDNLRAIIDIIHDEQHSLACDWIEPTYARKINGKKTTVDWKAIYEENVEAISRADVIIAETTYPSFGVGYQVASAVQQKKPTLVLRQKGSEAENLSAAIDNEVVEHKEYDTGTLRDILSTFLENNDIKSKDLRFNFFIDRQIYNYLRWASFKTSKTKAEILRELVLKEINKQDN